MIPTHWNAADAPVGTQLQLSYFSRPGELAQVTFHCTATLRPENHVVVNLRPDWKDASAYRDKPPGRVEPWTIPLACVQRVGDPRAKLGWVDATWLDVPLLLNS